MKVQGNRYINNPEMIKNKVEKKTTVPQNIISEDDVKISDSARKLVETARNKVSGKAGCVRNCCPSFCWYSFVFPCSAIC